LKFSRSPVIIKPFQIIFGWKDTIIVAMKIPIVKEYGSWAVFGSSFLAALFAGLMTRPWNSGREFSVTTFMTTLGLILLINAKVPFSALLRAKSFTASGESETGNRNKENICWFLIFLFAGLGLLMPFLIDGFRYFVGFSSLVISYSILMAKGREHHLIAEINGFALLTLSAPIIFFTVTGDISMRLYLAVLIFFVAGVFKVRVRIKKTSLYRGSMICYCIAAVAVFHFINISLILLVPLLENIISAIWMREEKLKTVGDIELAKGIIFIVLTGFFWK